MIKSACKLGRPSRLSSEILLKIFRLTLLCPHPLRIDAANPSACDETPEHHDAPQNGDTPPSYTHPTFSPSALLVSRGTYNQLIVYFWNHNTFSLRRSSLCAYHPPFRLRITPSQRFKVRNLLFANFAGTPTCHRLAIGARDSHANSGPARTCQNCNPATFPDYGTLFPNARLVTVDHGATRNSRIVYEQFCKAIVAQRGNQYLQIIGVGEAVLCNFHSAGNAVIVFEDRRLRQIWRTLTALDPKSLYCRTCPEMLAMKRLSLRTTEMSLRLLDFYDHECDFLLLAGEASGMRVQEDMRGELEGVFLTAFTWALREYLRTRDSPFVRALEGGGMQEATNALRLQKALLEEMGEYASVV